MLDEVQLAVDAHVQGGTPEVLAKVRAESTGGPAAGPPTVALAPIAARSTPKAVRAVAKAQSGQPVRRTAEDLERVGAAILDALWKSPGLTSERIQLATGMSKPETQKPLEDLRNAKRGEDEGAKKRDAIFREMRESDVCDRPTF